MKSLAKDDNVFVSGDDFNDNYEKPDDGAIIL